VLGKGHHRAKAERNVMKKSVWREWIESIVVAAVLAIFLRTFFFQIYKIPTTSMKPLLTPGDKIFVNKLVYGPKAPFINFRIPRFRIPERGEVIVFIPPDEAKKPWYRWKKHYIKRLIGVGGDRVRIENGDIYINDEIVVDSRITSHIYYNQGKYGEKGKEIIVPQDKYFFLGDNSFFSQDSRFWGFVDERDVVGKAIFIWWPPKRIGMIE